jgi:hypothetical protein
MKRRITLTTCAALIGLAAVAFAQLAEHEPVSTAPPASARYELIQNSRAMKETYLLDRFSGSSWQLVKSTQRSVWQKIARESHDRDTVPKDWSGPVYQVSVSGLAAKGTYMINVITGATWILYEDPEKGTFWGAIPAPK